jgi:hypothetical protein
MKDRRPRKLKKVAKKRRAKHVAMVTAQCAIAQALAMCQVMQIQARPILKGSGEDTIRAVVEKKVAIANCIFNVGRAAVTIAKQVKHWREYV